MNEFRLRTTPEFFLNQEKKVKFLFFFSSGLCITHLTSLAQPSKKTFSNKTLGLIQELPLDQSLNPPLVDGLEFFLHGTLCQFINKKEFPPLLM